MTITVDERVAQAMAEVRAALHRLTDPADGEGEFDPAELEQVERGAAAFVSAVAVACQRRADREPTEGLLVPDAVSRESWRWFAAKLAAEREGQPS